MPSSDFPGFADRALRSALTMVEIRGWSCVFVPHSAGSEFRDGHYHIFYRRGRAGMPMRPASTMVRTAQEVIEILQGANLYGFAEDAYPTSFGLPPVKRGGARVPFDLRGTHDL